MWQWFVWFQPCVPSSDGLVMNCKSPTVNQTRFAVTKNQPLSVNMHFLMDGVQVWTVSTTFQVSSQKQAFSCTWTEQNSKQRQFVETVHKLCCFQPSRTSLSSGISCRDWKTQLLITVVCLQAVYNLSETNPELSTFQYVVDPQFEKFVGHGYTRTFYEDETHLDIHVSSFEECQTLHLEVFLAKGVGHVWRSQSCDSNFYRGAVSFSSGSKRYKTKAIPPPQIVFSLCPALWL